MNEDIKDTLTMLINKELEEECEYQHHGEKDTDYIKALLRAKQWVIGYRAKGIDGFVNSMIIEDDIENYVKSLEDAK